MIRLDIASGTQYHFTKMTISTSAPEKSSHTKAACVSASKAD
jgi:hypothetical protein